ncbi:MAG: DUF3810 family protein [Trueperaceae bacterium]|nr:DUF3810 family protein [Trueperaceae bacterium]
MKRSPRNLPLFGTSRPRLPKAGSVTPGQARRIVLVTLGLLTATALWQWFPVSALWIERYYSRQLYPQIAALLVPLGDAVPFSIAPIVLLTLPLLLFFGLVRLTRRRRQQGRWVTMLLVAYRLFSVAALLYLAFVVLWGANYKRQPIEAQLGLDAGPVSEAEVETLARNLLALLNDTVEADRDAARALTASRLSLQNVVREATGVVPTLPEQIKILPAGTLIRLGGATGVVSPWTLEAHVDGALTPSEHVAVGLHELAHVAGYSGEADADLIAAIAGLRADDPFAQYATALRLFRAASFELPSAQRDALWDELPSRAREDTEMLYRTYRQFLPPAWVSGLQQFAYDRYLRSQGVTAGVSDYSRTTTLLVKAVRQGWVSFGDDGPSFSSLGHPGTANTTYH